MAILTRILSSQYCGRWFLTIIVLISVLLGNHSHSQSNALISFPPAKDVFLVSRFSDLFALTREPYLQNRTLLAIVTSDISMDSYLTLYMALIVEMFDDRDSDEAVEEITQQRNFRIGHFTKHIEERYGVGLATPTIQQEKEKKEVESEREKGKEKETKTGKVQESGAQETNIEDGREPLHPIDDESLDELLYSQHVLPLSLDTVKLNLSIILFTPNITELPLTEATALMLGLLPETSILITIQHGKHMFSFSSLSKLDAKFVLKAPGIVYHMNHERPWVHSTSKHFDFISSTDEGIVEQYKQFPLVLRNYYYDKLVEDSLYVPVFAPFYGHILNNFYALKDFERQRPGEGMGEKEKEKEEEREKEREKDMNEEDKKAIKDKKRYSSLFLQALQTPASQRPLKCWFRGRISYEYDIFYKLDRKNGKAMYANTSTAEVERYYLKDMKERQGLLKDCVVEERPFAGPIEGHDVESEYEHYIQELGQAAFSLCPAGNNPETFRLHESLDIGTIPIMIRHPVKERDFLRHPFWRDYPGPVLSHWREVEDYLQSMTDEAMDRLQLKLMKWYLVFKDRVRRETRAHIYNAIQSIERTPVETIRYPVIDLEMKARRKDIQVWNYFNYNYGMDDDRNIIQYDMIGRDQDGNLAILLEGENKKSTYAVPIEDSDMMVASDGSSSNAKPLSMRLDTIDKNMETIVQTINDIYGKMSTMDGAIMLIDQRHHSNMMKTEQELKEDRDLTAKLEGKIASLTKENVALTQRVETLEQEMKQMLEAMEMLTKLLR